ncbi:AAA family ATPase [Arcobacter vandammei]|uniref:AAA family ATPase n=1 Tax=Arcobacter vandammei TaxID=2782243 RepID=UPI0018DF270D|nr:AAA family ATPase [Arcobacter vandammei]
MINRVYIKNCLSFEEVNLEFGKGLNIFSGPSGAGKSILMQEILSLFAFNDVKSELSELEFSNSSFEDEAYGISINDDLIIKNIKKEKARYFLNNQVISKKNLQNISSKLIKQLNLKDTSDFESQKIIGFLDRLSTKNSIEFKELKYSFDSKYKEFSNIRKELEKLYEDEKKIEDLKEFARFEIAKIEEIDPKEDEYERLNSIKKSLAKKEKIEKAINKASAIFELNSSVNDLLNLLEVDSSFFDEAMNELNNVFEKSSDSLSELEDINIEEVLNRIEKISALQKRFGSIKEALEYKEEKKKELESYMNISFSKTKLEKEYKILEDEINDLAKNISTFRQNSLILLEDRINHYLKFLYLNNAKIELNNKTLDSFGIDEVHFELNQVSLNTISSGEYNRLRLALLSAISEFDIGENGVLFLDEIDANLSGKESDAISKVLITLSKNYQIFAISHQPQLTSSANQHFLVDKKDGVSIVRLLNNNEKITEIARMISGESVTNEAIEFAKNLLK